MATFIKENSAWLEFLPTAAGLGFNQRFVLTQAGPRERRAYLQHLRQCGDAGSSEDMDPESPCWWDIQIFGWTSTATITVAGVASALDPRVGGNRNPISHGTLRYYGDEIEFDVGTGAHFSVFAPSIAIGLMAPASSLAVGLNGSSNFLGTPAAPITVTSEAFNGIISPCVRPATTAELTRTETRVIVASIDVPVPARARTLQIFQNTASLPAAPMNWTQDAVSGFDLGQIDFQTTAAGRTAILDIPAGATVVRTGAAARTCTFVWGLTL